VPFPIETPRLILRRFCDADLEPFVAYRNDPEVFRYQGWKIPFTRAEGLQFIDEMKSVAPGDEGKWFQTALELKDSHALIGDVGFGLRRGGHGQAYFGFTLARPYWQQGYAGEAATAVLEYLFSELCLHRIMADCDTANRASWRLLERLGFRREGHHRQSFWLGDRWGDEYLYALLAEDWRAKGLPKAG
jgi:aminoglycoside 6'-N-acetyltransferase